MNSLPGLEPISGKKPILPPPPVEQTYNRLHPSLRQSIKSKSKYHAAVQKLKKYGSAPYAPMIIPPLNQVPSILMNLNTQPQPAPPLFRYHKNQAWTHHEFDDLYTAVSAELALKKSSKIWDRVQRRMKSGRNSTSIRKAFKTLAAGKSKDKYRHGEFAALASRIENIKCTMSDSTVTGTTNRYKQRAQRKIAARYERQKAIKAREERVGSAITDICTMIKEEAKAKKEHEREKRKEEDTLNDLMFSVDNLMDDENACKLYELEKKDFLNLKKVIVTHDRVIAKEYLRLKTQFNFYSDAEILIKIIELAQLL